ncbi:kelch repeat-containing protein [Paraburkholderia phenoliruptrix]|uniref:kelch repeat-containing protein n=1 Tax=Paraburkholderia phenoliruptrix TaxID=252970 RepID=UPI000AF98CAF|nr:kelch repeat-containing protein [Paraburkholderia phenoliruptrix]
MWTQLDDSGPAARSGFGIASDTTRNRVVLFGGFTYQGEQQQFFGDTWEWDGTDWTQQEETGPSSRSIPCMTFDSVRGRTVLFGGIRLEATDADVNLGDTLE